MKKLLYGTIALGLVSGVSAAQSISGTTDFQVKIPEVLVLYHWDKAVLEFKDYATHVEDTRSHKKANAVLSDASHTITENSVLTTTVPNGFSDSSLINVKLEKAWAVRAIAAGNVTLGIAIQEGDLLLNGTDNASKAVVSSATLSKTSITPSWTPTTGDINFKLNLKDVTKPGVHKTAATETDATDTFKLTLTGN